MTDMRPKIGHPWDRWDSLFVVAVFALTVVLFFQTLLPGKTLFGADSFFAAQVFWTFGRDYLVEHWRLPYWNPYIMSGMPYIGSLSASISPYDWFWLPFELMGIEAPHSTYLLVHMTFGGAMAYLYLGYLGLSRWSCILGGVLFAFNNYMVSRIFPGHGGKVCTLVMLPLGMYALKRAVEERKLSWCMVFGLNIGISYMQRHPQILFYSLLTYTAYFLYLAFPVGKRQGQWDIFGRLALVGGIASVLGMGVALHELWPHYEYKEFTIRGDAGDRSPEQQWAFNTSWSLPPEEAVNLVIQNPFGWEDDNGELNKVDLEFFYLGRMPARQAYEYVGVLPFILAIFAVVYGRRRREVLFFAVWTVVTLFLAMGRHTPVYALAWQLFPGFSFFRVPLMIFSITAFCLSVLPALGLETLLDRIRQGDQDRLKPFFAVAGGCIALWMVVFGGLYAAQSGFGRMLAGFYFEQLRGQAVDLTDRAAHIAQNGLFAGLLAVVSLGLLAGIAFARKEQLRIGLVVGAVAFAWLDIHLLNRDFIVAVPKESQADYFTPQRAIPILQHDDDIFRVFSFQVERYPNEYMIGQMETISGYHPMPIHDYSLLLRQIGFGNRITDMMNAKYLILRKLDRTNFLAQRNNPNVWPLLERFELIYDQDYYIYENTEVMPRAHLVYEGMAAPDNDTALQMTASQQFRPREMFVHTGNLPGDLQLPGRGFGNPGTATITDRTPESMDIDVETPADTMLVLSEIWFPGWQATVNGEAVDILRVNGILRGIPLKAGTHSVRMEFKPASHILSGYVSFLSVILIFMGMVLSGRLSSLLFPEPRTTVGRKGKRRRDDEDDSGTPGTDAPAKRRGKRKRGR